MQFRIRSALVSCFSLCYTLIRPLLGPSGTCRYYLTCSAYARKKISHERFLIIAAYKIGARLARCSFAIKRNNNYFDE